MRKRYKSAEQIIALIDKCKKEQAENAAQCQKLKDGYTNIYQWMAVQDTKWDSLNPAQKLKYRHESARAEQLNLNYNLLTKGHSRFETRLRRLKATLAAFQTETFPFVEDRSVVLQ